MYDNLSREIDGENEPEIDITIARVISMSRFFAEVTGQPVTEDDLVQAKDAHLI